MCVIWLAAMHEGNQQSVSVCVRSCFDPSSLGKGS